MNTTDRAGARHRARAPSRAIAVRAARWRSAPRETQDRALHARDDARRSTFENPRLWWPYRMGEPEPLHARPGGGGRTARVSDRQRGALRHPRDDLRADATRATASSSVNGKPILIRGGGWASDMMLRRSPPSACEAELRYVKRDGPQHHPPRRASSRRDEFFDLADREGILVMPGWCCCDHWETWDKWDAEDHRVAPASLRDQILRLRNHPSVLRVVQRQRLPAARRRWRRRTSTCSSELRLAASPVALERHRQAGPVSGPIGREDARALRLRAAVVLAHGHEERRRLRLRHRDQPRRAPCRPSRA